MNFGERLQQLMARQHLTQAELARIMDVPQQSVSRWVNSTSAPRAITIEKIAKALEVPTEKLTELVGEGTGYPRSSSVEVRLGLPRHLHADASVAAEAAGQSLHDELIYRLSKSSDTAHLHRVIEQLTETMKMEREGHAALMRHLLYSFEEAIRTLDEALLAAQHKNASQADIRRLIDQCNQARAAVKSFGVTIDKLAGSDKKY